MYVNKLGHKAKIKESLEALFFLASPAVNSVKMFVLMISRSSSDMGHIAFFMCFALEISLHNSSERCIAIMALLCQLYHGGVWTIHQRVSRNDNSTLLDTFNGKPLLPFVKSWYDP